MDIDKIYKLLSKQCDKKISKRNQVEKFNEKIKKSLSTYIKHYDSIMKDLMKEKSQMKNKKVNTCLRKNIYNDSNYSFYEENEKISVNNSFYIVKSALTKVNRSKERKGKKEEEKSFSELIPNNKSAKSLNKKCCKYSYF